MAVAHTHTEIWISATKNHCLLRSLLRVGWVLLHTNEAGAQPTIKFGIKKRRIKKAAAAKFIKPIKHNAPEHTDTGDERKYSTSSTLFEKWGGKPVNNPDR